MTAERSEDVDGDEGRPPDVGQVLPDFVLPDHTGRLRRLSSFTAPSEFDRHAGLDAGYPAVLVFYRGSFCPRDHAQLTELASIQEQLRVSYVQLITVSADPPGIAKAHRNGLGAAWAFLCDESRGVIRQLGLIDDTEGEYAFVSRPFTFVLTPDLRVHSRYDGWFFVGRPSPHELRRDLREVMARLPQGSYDAYLAPEVQQVRRPQQVWRQGAPSLGASGLPVADGVVDAFDPRSGNGTIRTEVTPQAVFFNFTAIPGSGYRLLPVGTHVRFELIDTPAGPAASHVEAVGDPTQALDGNSPPSG